MAHLARSPACKRITLVVCMCERRAREREGEGWGVRANLCCRLNRLFVQQVSVYTEVTEEDTLTHTHPHTRFWLISEEIRKNVAVMYRSPALENNQLMALYGQQREIYFAKDEDCISEVRLCTHSGSNGNHPRF